MHLSLGTREGYSFSLVQSLGGYILDIAGTDDSKENNANLRVFLSAIWLNIA